MFGMQEQTVEWEPITIYHPVPWQTKLLVFWVVGISIFSILRFAYLARHTWWQKESSQLFLEICLAKAVSARRLAVLTALLTTFCFAALAAQMMYNIGLTKVNTPAVMAAQMQEVFFMLAVGYLAAALLYALSSWFESTLVRRKIKANSQA